MITIERADGPSDAMVQGLAALLVDAVEDNAGISFMAGLRLDGSPCDTVFFYKRL